MSRTKTKDPSRKSTVRDYIDSIEQHCREARAHLDEGDLPNLLDELNMIFGDCGDAIDAVEGAES